MKMNGFFLVQATFEKTGQKNLKGPLHLTRPVFLLSEKNQRKGKEKFLQKNCSADTAFAWLVFSCLVGEKDIKYSL